MEAARQTVSKTFGSIERDVERLKGLFGTLFTGAVVSSFVGQLVNVQREFDVLNSSLITVTGSAANAEREFAWIKDFAATTPFALNEVTGAFVKMKALGLDASADSLRSYGNTASAMGKSLNQMIEAVADAATGEFERLKEFGIRASKEGDRVSLTFRGVTTTIGNSAEEITGYLRKIGEVDFAGAMELRAQTLDGALSNLADTWSELFRTISSQGVGNLIFDSVKLATGAIQDLITILGSLNGATAENAKQTGAMAAIQNGIATVFETVAVLGVNVKYVLTQIGTEIGGIMAQAAAILRGEFAQAGDIRRQMIADAESARAQVDATTSRILNARRLLDVAKTGEGMDEPRFARLLNATASQAKADQALGTTAAKTAQQIRDLARAEKERQQALEKQRADDVAFARQWQADSVAAMQAEEDRIEAERQAEIKLRRELQAERDNALIEQGVREREAADKLREEEAKEYAKHWDRISQSMTDALMQGGKSVAEYLKGLFRSLVLQPVLKMGVQGAIGALGLGGSSGALAGLLGSGSMGGIGDLLGSTSMGALDIGGFSLGGLGSALGYAGLALAAVNFLKGTKSPGEQHTGGFFSSSGMGTALGVTGGNAAAARDLTNRANPAIVSMVEQTVGAVIASTTANAKALGMDIALGIDAGFAANTNGQGKNPNAFGYFTMTANGETIAEFINRELGSDVTQAFQTFTQEMADAAAVFVLGGAQFVGAGETASQTLARLAMNMQSLKTPSEQFAMAQANLRDQFGALGVSVPQSTQALRYMIESTDMTTESGRQLRTQLLGLVPAFTQVSQVIEQTFNNISRTTAASVRDIEMANLSNAEKYAYLDAEIEELITQLSTATLPADIERLFNQINANTTTAFGLLDAEEQKRLGTQFIDALYEAEAIAQSRLDVAGQQADTVERQTQAVQMQAEAAQVQRDAAAEMLAAATEFRIAARELAAARSEPRMATLGTPSSREVAFS